MDLTLDPAWGFVHCEIAARRRGLKIAQRFSAGWLVSQIAKVPAGTAEGFFRPSGTHFVARIKPTVETAGCFLSPFRLWLLPPVLRMAPACVCFVSHICLCACQKFYQEKIIRQHTGPGARFPASSGATSL